MRVEKQVKRITARVQLEIICESFDVEQVAQRLRPSPVPTAMEENTFRTVDLPSHAGHATMRA
eukprot:6188716-Pleurochrysis_carterae.AAC.3